MKRTALKIAIAVNIAMALVVPSAIAEDYKLGVSDRLKVKVQEWPDLTGEYTVAADGAISLPLIGNIDARGLRVNDLAGEISDRLQRRSDGAERPVAAVEILQYRPFFIVGDVQHPGQYPYRPGLTVLGAISIAGGYYRPEFGLLRLDRDMALAKGEMRALSLKRCRLLAREARLTAALAGRADLPFPPELADRKDDPDIVAIVEGERSVLDVENNTIRSEQAEFEKIKALYNSETESLRGQVNALARERDSTQEQLKQFRALSAKGLALAPTVFSMERSLAQIVNEQLNIETAIVKAQESIALAEHRLNERAQERRKADERDLQQTKDNIAEVRARIKTQGDLLMEAQISAPAEARARLAEKDRRSGFTLVRKNGETTREIAADETALVQPDDIIKVPVIRSEPYEASNMLSLSQAKAEKADR
ncbi:polysaccharide biosynthesis/export family protein [Bradyrhizobium sp. ISRA443]|uniref:polysaccharide biosynthesis/export family protein n=1 Tax=unclassified Bradyrhizobium TaxID=2631580 RepID=UPI00247837A1|nr:MULTISPECIES: polysaccharide biosynthesis/export family protein [unclassified Bradyrhizobium]WGR96400.1 polysaccharide biosynthesis/export family protein [Bradyrhizobium sp. ISRA436]WGS03285.1 polysaccharide biosynthesis/export family protein [Bradyrhizobium sp. ISRA437]WGS10169.1 polysaccharide biosynthesis/export family protein [Bradyrhizobium sp. ISRA443]